MNLIHSNKFIKENHRFSVYSSLWSKPVSCVLRFCPISRVINLVSSQSISTSLLILISCNSWLLNVLPRIVMHNDDVTLEICLISSFFSFLFFRIKR